jgi:DNA repair protein RecO (recombination protein O)
VTFLDEALVVRREIWRECDKRITFFTQHHGLVHGVAIGAQKMTSKLSAHLEPFRHVEVMLAAGKNGYTVAQVETKKNFVFGVASETVQLFGLYARLIQKIVEPGAHDSVLFGLLLHTYEAAHAGDEDPGNLLYMIAQHVGVAPEFQACVVCGGGEPFLYFSAELGGVVCGTCPQPSSAALYNAQKKDQLFSSMKLFFEWRGLC